MKKTLLLLSLLFIFSMPVVVQDFNLQTSFVEATEKREPTNSGGGNGIRENTDSGGQQVKSIKLNNPLSGGADGEIKDIPTLVQRLLTIVVKIGVPLVALAIIYVGYMFIAAQGKPDDLKKAKDALVWVVVGAAILLGAYVIAQSIFETVKAIKG